MAWAASATRCLFQSLDWVDVDFDVTYLFLIYMVGRCFNPSTGLMLISTPHSHLRPNEVILFQSLDWVDVDFD